MHVPFSCRPYRESAFIGPLPIIHSSFVLLGIMFSNAYLIKMYVCLSVCVCVCMCMCVCMCVYVCEYVCVYI
jgi:hypothetical protein